MIKRKAFWALLAAGMTVVSTGIVSAQSTTILPRVGMLWEFKKKSLVGSWLETVTFPPDENGDVRVLKSLVSFHADGTMMASDQGSVTLGPNPPPGVSSSGVGAWTQLDWHTFAYTDKELFSDLSGKLTGFLRCQGSIHYRVPGTSTQATPPSRYWTRTKNS